MYPVAPLTHDFLIDCNQAAATYDAAVATNRLMVESVTLFVDTAAAAPTTFLSIQTNQTTALELLSAIEGAVGNLTVGATIIANRAQETKFVLMTGDKIQYTIGGGSGAGKVRIVVKYRPLVAGARLS